jgi:nucleotide-binding universal stress UspA family protein
LRGSSRRRSSSSAPTRPIRLRESPAGAQLASELREDAEATLARARARLEQAERAECHAVAGPVPSRVLHELAAQRGAQAIALGATHRGAGRRRASASTSRSSGSAI